MVSIRRVKYVFKLLIVSTIVFCLIFFHKWKEDISYQAKVRRYFEEIREQDDQQLTGDKKNSTVHDSDNYLIVEQAQELDVDQILEKLKDDFSNREVTLKNNSVQKPEDVAKVNDKGFQMSSGQNETSKLAAVNVTLRSENVSSVHSKHSHKFKNEMFKWKKMQWQPSMRGKLNVHIWQAWCGSTIHDLRRSKFFPQWPDLHLTSDQFFIHHGEEDFGQRIFGYLHPPVTGKYRFAIASDDSSELWISTDDSPLNVRLVSWVGNLTSLEGAFNTEVAQFTKYPTQISRPLFLDQGKKYFVEALHKQARNFDHIMIGWKVPGMAGLRHISGKSISLYINDTQLSNDVTEYAKYIPMDLPSHSHHEVLKVQLESTIHPFATVDPYDKRHKSSLVNNSHITSLFPSCDYFPSYLVDFKLKRYQGVQLIHDTAIYPDDDTDLIHMKQFDKCRIRRYKDSHGNKVPTSVSLTKLNNDSLYGSGGRIKVKLLKEEVDEEFEKEILQFDGGNPEDILPLNKLNKRKGRKNIAIVSQQTNAIPNYSIKKEKGLKKLPKMKKEQKSSRKVSTFQYSTEKNMSPKIRHLLSVEVETNMIQKKYKERLEAARQRRLRIAHEQRKAVAGSSRHRTGTRNSHSVHISHKYASTVNRHMPDRRSLVSHRETAMSQRRLPPWLMPTDSAENFMYRFRSAWSYVRQILKMVYHDNFKVNITSLERNVYRRWNIRLKVPSTFYAEDFTAWIFHQNSSKCGSDPNLLLSENVAQSVVYRYMKALKKKFGSLYSLKKILNVEENHDILKGDRYLVELELNVKGQENPVRLSQFIYQKIGETSFCLPKGFVLNPHSTVHVIVPVKNQGKWVQYLIEDMSEIYRKTRDPHFNLIIVDFDSNDIDIEAALHRSDLKRYQLIKLKGPFQRALGIQVGTEAVTGNHDIIFTCDLHLDTPVNLIDIIRKHCVEGKMAFAPIVNRLHCGFTPSLPYGFWELQGYGLFAIYKSDYQRIGGMNYREFKTRWGGEDWEMLDRVLAKKIEVERLRIARFYHFFHSKKGMWGEKNLADTALVNKAGGSSSQNGRIVLFEEDPSYYKFAGRRTTTRKNKIPTKISTSRKQRSGTAKVANNH